MEQNSIPKDVSVILIHPCEVVRHGIGLLLQQSGYRVPLLVDSCESMLKELGDLHADLVLMHYSNCKPGGIIKQIIDCTGANVACLASSDYYHQDCYRDMLEQIAEGITGFLDMDESLHNFLSELDDIASGDIVVSKNFKKNLTQNVAGIEDKLDEILSDREIQILDLVGTGNTNKEIGEELFISEHTVKVHLRSILTKLNLKNRQQAVAYTIRKGLITGYHAGGK